MDESGYDDVLEPLPVYEDTAPPRAAPKSSIFEPPRPAIFKTRRFTATFSRLTDLDPDLLADLPDWWRRRSKDAPVRVSRRLVLDSPRLAPSGTWQVRGFLRSPWLRRWIPVELQLWPRLGAWTKVSLEPQRHVHVGRRYFTNGHRALDALTARLATELHRTSSDGHFRTNSDTRLDGHRSPLR